MSTLAELGEAELLQRLALFAPPGQLDDDTACLAPDPRSLIVNTDVLVDGIHFSDNTTSAEDAGWRAVAANLSDLAASGVTSVDGITVGLVAPGDTRWEWVEGVYGGISSALNQFGGVLLGGDCSAGTNRLLAITALAATAGAAFPLLFDRMGLDPALMSTPFITTCTDVAGTLIYLKTASWLLVNLPSLLSTAGIFTQFPVAIGS